MALAGPPSSSQAPEKKGNRFYFNAIRWKKDREGRVAVMEESQWALSKVRARAWGQLAGIDLA
jgi:hypothetical protein